MTQHLIRSSNHSRGWITFNGDQMLKGRGNNTRSDKDKNEYVAGKVRALEKRLRIAERENARLKKFIGSRDYELYDEDSEDQKPSKKRVCKQPGCKSTEFFFLEIPNKIDIKRFYTCKACGKREKESVKRPLET